MQNLIYTESLFCIQLMSTLNEGSVLDKILKFSKTLKIHKKKILLLIAFKIE